MTPDFKRWEAILADPLWHIQLVPEIRACFNLSNTDPQAYERVRDQIYDFFEKQLADNAVALAAEGREWDSDRQPIDTIVIHHTSNAPGLSLERLSAIELVRLYAPVYTRPKVQHIGKSIWSNHLRGGKQVFWPYHWFIRENGKAERLLEDREIGWHAGDWGTNARSIAICLDADFEHGLPGTADLESIASIIRRYYPQVDKSRIIGHCEVNDKTTCPSQYFLTTEHERGWKEDLLALL